MKKNNKTSIEELREKTQTIIEQENLINQLIKKPELIENWSIKNLETLEKICDEKIKQLDFEINVMKGKSILNNG